MFSYQKDQFLNSVICDMESNTQKPENNSKTKNSQIFSLQENIVTVNEPLEKELAEKAELKILIESGQNELFGAGGENLENDIFLKEKQDFTETQQQQIDQKKKKIQDLKKSSDQLMSCKKTQEFELSQCQNKIKQNYGKSEGLNQQETQNFRLANDNRELHKVFEFLKVKEIFLKSHKSSSLGMDQFNFLREQRNQQSQQFIDFKTMQLPVKQEAPPQRRLLRKPRIQVDFDTFKITPINS